MTKQNTILLEAGGITKHYRVGRTEQQVLTKCDLTVKRGELVAIMGASGSGKSTLLHILGVLDRPDSGHVKVDGQDVSRLSGARQDRLRNQEIGFVFQFYHLLAELNVLENVMLPAMVARSVWRWGRDRKVVKEQALAVLETVGLAGQLKQRPATLSGGERQRVAIARALIQKPPLLLADEPTGNLDSATGKVILELLCELNRAGQTIVMVTHDQAVAELADRQLVLRDGRLG